MYYTEFFSNMECAGIAVLLGFILNLARTYQYKVCRGGEVLPENIHSFQGCNIIDGNLRLFDTAFKLDSGSADRSSKMHPDALEVFSTVREIHGYLEIMANHSDFKNLSYFRNLEIIHGSYDGLLIYGTSLESLNLRSLCEVRTGDVRIAMHPKLCFPSGIDWEQIIGPVREYRSYVDIRENAAEDFCRERGLVCHEQCKHGCWGAGPEDCLWSGRYKFNDMCVPDCNETLGFYDAGKWMCDLCDLECRGIECVGRTNPPDCLLCRNVEDGSYCASQCPMNKSIENGKCMSCDENCVIKVMKIVKINGDNKMPAVLGGVFGCVVLTICAAFVYKRMQRKENSVLITMEMITYEDDEPLEPSNVKPNLAKLIVIKESDLIKIGNFGRGAFGTVYKGLWMPEGENAKIPLAIEISPRWKVSK